MPLSCALIIHKRCVRLAHLVATQMSVEMFLGAWGTLLCSKRYGAWPEPMEGTSPRTLFRAESVSEPRVPYRDYQSGVLSAQTGVRGSCFNISLVLCEVERQ
jgi:hypothetical protein